MYFQNYVINIPRENFKIRKKNPRNQRWEPIQQNYKANEDISKHNSKTKQKQTIDKNPVKTTCKKDSWL
jgi:hypothetical protein